MPEISSRSPCKIILSVVKHNSNHFDFYISQVNRCPFSSYRYSTAQETVIRGKKQESMIFASLAWHIFFPVSHIFAKPICFLITSKHKQIEEQREKNIKIAKVKTTSRINHTGAKRERDNKEIFYFSKISLQRSNIDITPIWFTSLKKKILIKFLGDYYNQLIPFNVS